MLCFISKYTLYNLTPFASCFPITFSIEKTQKNSLCWELNLLEKRKNLHGSIYFFLIHVPTECWGKIILDQLVKFSSFLGDDEVIIEGTKSSWYLCEESLLLAKTGMVWYNVEDKQWSFSSFTVSLKLAVKNLQYRFVWPFFSPFNFGFFKMWHSYLILIRKICAFLKLNNEKNNVVIASFEIAWKS